MSEVALREIGMSRRRPWQLVCRCLPVFLPLVILVGTGLRGLDYGLHWDERPYQIGPVKHMVQRGTVLPGYYNYPSFDYWLNLLVLSPDIVTSRPPGESSRQHFLHLLDSHAYLLRLRAVYLLITSLSLVWVYLLVRQRGGNWLEALFAASLLGCSWEVAYHLRWVATDGMLMQFGALTVLMVVQALQTRSDFWLMSAAVASGFGAATKYPGGLLFLPLLLTALFIGGTGREKRVRLFKVTGIFALVYLAITPATVLQPLKLAHAVSYEMKHYASGHGGHTVGRGLEHFGRMFTYFATALWSPYLVIAVLFFALGIVGVVTLVTQQWRETAVLLVFPAAYFLYFTTQGTMVVRNLLAVAPFLAVAAARGARVVADSLHRREPSSLLNPFRWLRPSWFGLLVVCLCLNAWWLIESANSIVARHTDRFIHETAEYIRAHPRRIFLLSPRLKQAFAIIAPALQNVTADPAKTDAFVLYAREGMQRWHDWPANRRNLSEACFGPREVNFNFYPAWWGDDHIVVIGHRRAAEISLHIAAISPDTAPTPLETHLRESSQNAETLKQSSPELLPGSWASNGMATNDLPAVDPRNLVTAREAQAIIGPSVVGPATGGWELDGRACTFIASGGVVISLSVISTNAFALQRFDPGSAAVPGVGLAAYAVRGDPPGDIRLFSRDLNSAVVIHVSGLESGAETRLQLAKNFATKALDKLDEIGESRMSEEPLRRAARSTR